MVWLSDKLLGFGGYGCGWRKIVFSKSQGFSFSYLFCALDRKAGRLPDTSRSRALFNHQLRLSSQRGFRRGFRRVFSQSCVFEAMFSDDIFHSRILSFIKRVSGHGKIWAHHPAMVWECANFTQICSFPSSVSLTSSGKSSTKQEVSF